MSKSKKPKTRFNAEREFTKKDTIANVFADIRFSTTFKTESQKNFNKIIEDHRITICSGLAGCGKTHIAVFKALEMLRDNKSTIERIYLVKPNVEVGEKLGFLPGTVEEKIYMYMISFYDIFESMIGEANTQYLKDQGLIKDLPYQFLRGRTLNNAFVIIDECQNMSMHEIKTILTRIGSTSKYVLLGDTGQMDKKPSHGEKSGLDDALTRFKDFDKIGKFTFSDGDSVRDPLINELLKFY
jgi:phosphate starvation-inducible protein PhoH and related proteins